MDAYHYFRLNAPPFESRPDPRFFVDLPGHAEALATLHYAIRRAKPALLVVGESGSGKTLLAQTAAQAVPPPTQVVWIHGLDQPPAALEVTFCRAPPEPPTAPDAPAAAPPVATATLARWLRRSRTAPCPALLLVDNADELNDAHWRELNALLARPTPPAAPLTVVLLALPALEDRLAAPRFVRIRRRLFRTGRLAPLAREQTARYVERRLALAGRSGPPLFAPAALDRVHELSRGVPGLINQLCENALLDAFSEDAAVITPAHVLAAARALGGAQAPDDPADDESPTVPANESPTHRAGTSQHCTGTPPTAPLDELATAPIDDLPTRRLQLVEQRVARALRAAREATAGFAPNTPAPV